jgi:hypothetical protein
MQVTGYFHVGQAHRVDVVLASTLLIQLNIALEKGRKVTEFGLLTDSSKYG